MGKGPWTTEGRHSTLHNEAVKDGPLAEVRAMLRAQGLTKIYPAVAGSGGTGGDGGRGEVVLF